MGNDPCRLMLLPVASAELAKPMLLTPYAILLRKPFARAYTFASLGTLAHILLWVPHTHVGLGACIIKLPQITLLGTKQSQGKPCQAQGDCLSQVI